MNPPETTDIFEHRNAEITDLFEQGTEETAALSEQESREMTDLLEQGAGGPLFLICTHKDRLQDEVRAVYENVRQLTGSPFGLAAFGVSDWNRDYSPWRAEADAFPGGFSGGGPDTLSHIEENIIPVLNQRAEKNPGLASDAESAIAKDSSSVKCRPVIIAGYSLAGLFALWSFYESSCFSGAVCCSGSLWFPGWEDYARAASAAKSQAAKVCPDALSTLVAEKNGSARSGGLVYLSLGGKEERAKDPLVSTIGDRTRSMDILLSKDPGIYAHKLEWNSGGHFADSSKRLAKGIAWAAAQVQRLRDND